MCVCVCMYVCIVVGAIATLHHSRSGRVVPYEGIILCPIRVYHVRSCYVALI